MKKRILSVLMIVLCLVLLGAALRPVEAQAAELASGTCGSGVTWTLDSSYTLTISGEGAMSNFNSINVPWKDYRGQIKKVIVEDGVTSIGEYAFKDCTRLSDVTIKGEASIGKYAFSGCENLYSVSMDKVTSVGNYAFTGSAKLTKLSMLNVKTIGEQSFRNCTRLTTLNINNATYVGPFAFSGCTALGSASLNNVTHIDEYAFYDCSNLVTITMPKVDYLDSCAFKNCAKLTGVEFPATLTHIANSCFANDIALTSITLPESVLTVDLCAFSDCTSIKELVVKGNTFIGDSAFARCTALQTADLSQVTTIDDCAFIRCAALSSVNMPNVIDIEDSVFLGCTSLTEAVVNNASEIGGSAFSGCTALETVSMESVCEIGSYAFSQCEKLTSVHIPYTLDADGLGYGAFSYCTGLATVKIDAICSISHDAFFKCVNLSNLYIPDVTYIGGDAFHSCSSLAVVDMPWVCEIGSAAFYGCSNLTAIGVSSQLTSVGYNTFGNCSALTDIYNSGTAADWNAVQIASGNDPLLAATVHHNSTIPAVRISSSPATKKVKSGTSVTFQVKAIGNGLNYQWQYRTSSKGSWKNATATGNKTAILKLSATTGRSGYQYRCKITDSNGNVAYSKAAYLYVLGVKTQPASAYLKADNTATFTVKATGHNKTYQWQYRTSASGSWKNTTVTGAKTDTLKIKATAAKNGYQYRCKIKDSAGNVVYSKAATLYPLDIKTQPANKTVNSGTTATFKVVATGGGLTYQWQYRASASGSWKKTTATGAKTAALKIPATAKRNGYQYRCKITDAKGNVIFSNQAILRVR